MDFTTLSQFRQETYACLHKADDALMNTVDALLTQTSAKSLPELSLSPFFHREWSSLYEAFQDADIDRKALLDTFAKFAPLPPDNQRLLLAGDASSILRTQSPTARDRTYVHASNLPERAKPVRPGWQYSELAILSQEKSSWVYLLDNQRISSDQTQAQVMAEQLREATLRLPRRPLFLGDGYYGSEIFLHFTADIECDVLVRFSKNRVLYREPEPVEGKPGKGHPRWHGQAFKLNDPTTQGTPDACFEGSDENGARIQVHAWHNLHFRKTRQHQVSVYCVTREGAKDTKRDPTKSWFVFWGKEAPAPKEVPVLYGFRYQIEHGYRHAKQDLLWETPRLRTPESFSVWTDVVSIVRNTLYLSRDLVDGKRRSWERKQGRSTPAQVRRGMGQILVELGTPAGVCRVRGYSPGWCLGRSRSPAPTYKVVFKDVKKASKEVEKTSKSQKEASKSSLVAFAGV